MDKFNVVIVEDVKLELKGTEEIFRHDIPQANIIGTAMNEAELWPIIAQQVPHLVLLDLGLGGGTPPSAWKSAVASAVSTPKSTFSSSPAKSSTSASGSTRSTPAPTASS
jgi:DNA-binding NarL/FixJ family response regulator